MQTKGQWKNSRNWKVVGAVAAASALGLTGIAVASEGGSANEPEPIRLQDTTKVTEVTTVSTVPITVEDALNRVVQTASVSSPLDDDRPAPQVSASSPVSPDQPSPASPASPASPDQPSPASPASPDQPSPASPATPDEPSVQSAASPVSAQSAASPVSAQSAASANSGD
ncbi:MAG TPA: hypothetical protein VK011_03680 [Acidimicrobiia bacterium]|nr:hypothetical protein [Acidimicrobiia bacterium]